MYIRFKQVQTVNGKSGMVSEIHTDMRGNGQFIVTFGKKEKARYAVSDKGIHALELGYELSAESIESFMI